MSNILNCSLKENGDVAQLARALDWQSRGRGFESHLLHLVIIKRLQEF